MEPRQSLGNYRLVREIGRGSMGTVYLAHQESLGRDLAIKVLPAELTREADFLERFKREARIAASLRHPNIIQVFDAAESDGCHYLVMEYLGGRDLRECLQPGVPYGVEATLKLIDQVLSALQHAHEHGVVHRDVKPANVLVAENGIVTLTDFSIAHCRDSVRLTRTGMMVGTPEYMAPEQFEGEGVDARADLYATGVILYEMLTGVQPFRGQTTPEVMKAHLFKRPQPPGELNREVSQAVSEVVMRALEKDREVRYASAGEMREALKQAAGEPAGNALEQFLAAVVSGRVSMDEAIAAHSKVKEAIDQGFRRVLTVMFVDLAGSSKLKTPNQTFHADQAFRAYRSLINGALESHGCLSYDWSGDGAICLFQEPVPAVQAAVQIQQRIAQLNARSQLSGVLLARIGINTGDVYLDPRRSLGEFASRTVDQAGHLEKDCPPGSIYLSQATAQAVSSLCVLEEVGLNRDQVLVFRVQIPDLPPEAASTQMFCARCGTGMPREARFCPACGQATASSGGSGSGGHSSSSRPSGSLSGSSQPAPAALASRVQPSAGGAGADSSGTQRTAQPADSTSRARPPLGPADSASRSQPILPPPPSESSSRTLRPASNVMAASPPPQPAPAAVSIPARPVARFHLWWGWTCYAIFTVAFLLGVGLAKPVITGTGLIALACMHLVALGSGVVSLINRRWMTLAQIVGAFLFFALLTGAVWNVHQGRMTP